MTKLHWNPNTIVLPLGDGLLRLYQTWYRRNVVITRCGIDLIDSLCGGIELTEFRRVVDRLTDELQVADCTAFTLWENAYNNSDYWCGDTISADLKPASGDELIHILLDAGVATDRWPPKFEFQKQTFGDRYKGNFHEQLGTEALYNRTQPDAWWTMQKFTDDGRAIRETPYKYIEEKFLEQYFADLDGGSVMEIGCGTGYFTQLVSLHVDRAVGVDVNSAYVSKAKQLWPREGFPNLEFHVLDIVDLKNSQFDERFDYILLIDTFLFLFGESYQGHLADRRDEVMRNISAVLKPDGALLILDPHPFWLTPWFGLPDRPFGIVTEYNHRVFKVTPTLSEMSELTYRNGMRIRRIIEPQLDEAYHQIDPQGAALMSQLPQWWFFEIERANRT